MSEKGKPFPPFFVKKKAKKTAFRFFFPKESNPLSVLFSFFFYISYAFSSCLFVLLCSK